MTLFIHLGIGSSSRSAADGQFYGPEIRRRRRRRGGAARAIGCSDGAACCHPAYIPFTNRTELLLGCFDSGDGRKLVACVGCSEEQKYKLLMRKGGYLQPYGQARRTQATIFPLFFPKEHTALLQDIPSSQLTNRPVERKMAQKREKKPIFQSR